MTSTAEPTETPNPRGAYRGPVCGAKKRQGEGVCTQPAGWGTAHRGVGCCKLHGGRTRNHNLAAMREMAGIFMGRAIEVEPWQALLQCVYLAAGQVAYATTKVEQVPAEHAWEQDAFGTQHLNRWGRLQNESMERLARFSKLALDAGITERAVEVAENQGASLARVPGPMFEELHLTEQQQEALPALLARHLQGQEQPVGSLFTVNAIEQETS